MTRLGLRQYGPQQTRCSAANAIVLFHTWPFRTEQALPGIVSRLRDAGARFVRIDKLALVTDAPTYALDEEIMTWPEPGPTTRGC